MKVRLENIRSYVQMQIKGEYPIGETPEFSIEYSRRCLKYAQNIFMEIENYPKYIEVFDNILENMINMVESRIRTLGNAGATILSTRIFPDDTEESLRNIHDSIYDNSAANNLNT